MTDHSDSVSYPIAGGCFCGEIRYEIKSAPNSTGICHCQSCRQIAGAESVAWAVNDDQNFQFTKGKPKYFESSRGIERSYCEHCGTCLTYRYREDQIDNTLASLDDPEVLPPKHEVWCEDRISWNSLNDSLVQHEKGSGN